MSIPLPPGVPPLLKPTLTINGITNVVNTAALLIADSKLISSLLNPPKWGLYKGGALVVQADSVINMAYRQESKISDYPQEEGSFQQYNKVGSPYDARLQLSKGGTVAERSTFLAALEAAADSLDLYDVVTPEKTYTNANIQRYDYERKATGGANLILAEIWLIQIRTTAVAKLSATKRASGASAVNAGTLQADIASARQTAGARGAQ